MPILDRKLTNVELPPILPKSARYSPETNVWTSQLTKEVFGNYMDYSTKVMLCRRRIWKCIWSQRTKLTYEQALQSERIQENKLIQSISPKLRLQLIQLISKNAGVNKIIAITSIIDRELFAYQPGDTVNLIYDNKKFVGEVLTIKRASAQADFKKASKDFEVKYRVQIKDSKQVVHVGSQALQQTDKPRTISFNFLKQVVRKWLSSKNKDFIIKALKKGVPTQKNISVIIPYIPISKRKLKHSVKKEPLGKKKIKLNVPQAPQPVQIAPKPIITITYPIEDLEVESIGQCPLAGFFEDIPELDDVVVTWSFLSTFREMLLLPPIGLCELFASIKECVESLEPTRFPIEDLFIDLLSIAVADFDTIRHFFVPSDTNGASTTEHSKHDSSWRTSSVPIGIAEWGGIILNCLKELRPERKFPGTQIIIDHLESIHEEPNALLDSEEIQILLEERLGSRPSNRRKNSIGKLLDYDIQHRFYTLSPELKVRLIKFLIELCVGSYTVKCRSDRMQLKELANRKEKSDLLKQLKNESDQGAQIQKEIDEINNCNKNEKDSSSFLLTTPASSTNPENVEVNKSISTDSMPQSLAVNGNGTESPRSSRLGFAKSREEARERHRLVKIKQEELHQLNLTGTKLENKLQAIWRQLDTTFHHTRMRFIGQDRFYNRYYFLNANEFSTSKKCNVILVERIWNPQELSEIVGYPYDYIANRTTQEAANMINSRQDHWCYYAAKADVVALFEWLNDKGNREKLLKYRLTQLIKQNLFSESL